MTFIEAFQAVLRGPPSQQEREDAAKCVAMLRGARAELERAGRSDGGPFDHVRLSLMKEQVAMLFVLVDRELPKID